MITPDLLPILLPLAAAWAEKQEAIILRDGVPLTATTLADARTIGLLHPEKVRLRVVPEIPMPDDPVLRQAAEVTGLISPFTIGLTLRYGIYIREDAWGDRCLIAHELVHTLQYERLGGEFLPFLKKYLHECLTVGYPNGEMELEAKRISAQICEPLPKNP